jgi:hypothetical protein
MYASGGFYNGVATQSLRYNDNDSPYLQKTFSGGDQQSWTWSGWVKRGNLGQQNLFGTEQDGSNIGRIEFRSDHKIKVNNKTGNTNGDECQTLAVYRDVSAWYHIIVTFDGSQSTQSNRTKIYVNGVLQDKQTDLTLSAGNGLINSNKQHAVGARGVTLNTHFDGYMAEVNFVDGQTLDETDFGEFKNGVWIAKAYTGSYGTNGFRLQFNQTGTGTGSSSTIGADTSGDANHFTSSGIVASDCDMPDSPENNFCTYNPLDPKGNDNTFSEGNLEVVVNAQNTDEQTTGTFAVSSGKWYWEHRLNSTTTTAGYFKIGLRGTDADGSAWTVRGTDGETQDSSGSTGSSTVSYTTNNVIGIYLDMDNSKWYVSVDGVLQNNANLTNGTGFLHNNLTGEVRPFILNASSGGTHTGQGNFGQDSTFAGEESAGGNSDANGNGDFHSSVFSGYLALCTSNLPEPTISPNETTQADDYFNTTTWTAESVDGSTKTITVGFKPDFIWGKPRNRNADHMILDSSRGFTTYLRSNGANAEATFDSFVNNAVTSTGYDLDDDEDGYFNYAPDGGTADTMVAWNWKANGGTTSSNTDGTITSTVQANTDAGFSIVKYTGNGSGTIGHGLGVTPDFFFIKNLDQGTYNWNVWHKTFTGGQVIYFNLTNSRNDDPNVWNNTLPTSTVISVDNVEVNNSGDEHIAYCFAEIEGYSKFGSYTGNGSSDGTFVYTGFRPAWLMVKVTNISGENWHMFDSERAPFNVVVPRLIADDSTAENNNDNILDFTSNGFKWRDSNAGYNGSGNTYIYMAFAENPFKYANAR